MKRLHQLLATVLLTVPCLSGCGQGGLTNVRGEVTVDGAPAEMGTISFKPASNPTGRGAGAALNAGQFELVGDQSLEPGKYLVAVQAMRSTGKTFNHPQQGPVPMSEPIQLSDSPKEVEITSDNADQLQIGFSTKGQ